MSRFALIAGAAWVYALGDVRRLFSEMDDDVWSLGIANVCVDTSCHGFGVDVAGACDFTTNDEKAMGTEGFDGNAALGVFFEIRIENGVRNLVADLVWMARSNGFDGINFRGVEHIIKIPSCQGRM